MPWVKQFTNCLAGLDPFIPTLRDPKVHFLFPSHDTVTSSTYGINGGGTIFFNGDLEKSTYPREILFDCKSSTFGSLMHSKIILYNKNGPPPLDRPFMKFLPVGSSIEADGHFYLGSHNHTKAAWGGYQKKKPILSINNWEMGIILLFKWTSDRNDFQVPFQIPPLPMSKPWNQKILASTK